jgi:lysophospholipid acyltransferase (LPLAT)-like uncharacterized protein
MNPVLTEQKRRSSTPVVPHAPVWYQRLAAWVLFLVVRVVMSSVRYTWTDRSGYFDSSSAGPAIYCVWHNRLPLCMTAYFGRIKKRTRTSGLAVMVSASKDGGLLTAILECFKVQPVRGSSSRRGHQALLELTSWARRGYNVALTPDGPRGPRYVVQEGIMSLAQLTGFPVIPVSYSVAWKICLNTWDKFQIPVPFTRCEIIFEKPIYVPRDANSEERETFRQQLETTLRAISRD